ARGIAETQDAETGGDVTGKLLFPVALHLRLDGNGLERLDAGDAFDQECLVLRAALEFLGQPSLEKRRHAHRNSDVERERAEDEQGAQRRVQEHYPQKYKSEKQIDDESQRRAGEKITDILQLAHPRHRIADAA